MKEAAKSRSIFWPLAFLLLGVSIGATGCGEDTTTGPGSAIMADPMVVAAQTLAPSHGKIAVDSVYSDGPGWLVVHRDNGQNAPVVPGIIGRVHIDSGVSTHLTIPLDSAVENGEKIWLMLHDDDGVIGSYEFEGANSPDQPVTVGTAVVMISTTISQTDPSISVSDQILENNGVSIAKVASPEEAWLVFHKSEAGEPGEVITSIRVDSGSNGTTAQFPKEPAYSLRAGDTVWAMLHLDRGTTGTYEFPGPDRPMRDRNGAILMQPFVILPPDIQSVVAVDQPIDEGTLFVQEIHSDNPGWIVLHEDDGTGRPKEDKGIGWTRVWSGTTTGAEIKIETTITPNVRIWAVLHHDATPVGSYDYPASDLPVEDAGEIVADSFEILE